MRNFKKHCCVANITDSYKASTEECITGLRDQIKSETEEHCLEVTSMSCRYDEFVSGFRSIEFDTVIAPYVPAHSTVASV